MCYLERAHVCFDTLLLFLPLTSHRNIAFGEQVRQLFDLARVAANRLPEHLPSLSFTRLPNLLTTHLPPRTSLTARPPSRIHTTLLLDGA